MCRETEEEGKHKEGEGLEDFGLWRCARRRTWDYRSFHFQDTARLCGTVDRGEFFGMRSPGVTMCTCLVPGTRPGNRTQTNRCVF